MKHTLLLLLLSLCYNGYTQSNLVYEDRVYDPQIKTVQLYPDGGGAQDYLLSPAASVGTPTMTLEFDDLRSDRNNYYVKIIHCNADWTKSTLNDLDYLNDYNEFPINNYALSGSTFQTYLHYTFQIPVVNVAGNYLIIAYRDDQSHLILSKRMMIYLKTINILPDKTNDNSSSLSFTLQPLNFMIDYSAMEILNPLESVTVVIRQNQRWDNAKMDVKPSFVRDADSQLEYRFVDNTNAFTGGNEFRFVDFKSLNSPGQNTGKMNKTVRPYQLTVQTDLPRIDQAYSQYNDIDGHFTIDNTDSGEPKTNSSYIPVTFTLKWDQEVQAPVYLMGAFNGWARNAENLMKYNTANGNYTVTILLKQGLYNYQYYVDSKSPDLPGNYFEGDHFETENTYEILIYNRGMSPNVDALLGYYTLTVNPRQ